MSADRESAFAMKWQEAETSRIKVSCGVFVTHAYTGRLKKSFTMVFKMLLRGECYNTLNVGTPLSVNVFVTLATSYIWNIIVELFETPCITSGSHIEPQLSQVKRIVFFYIMTVQKAVHVLWINPYKLSKL
jgi:hypothetical protein